MVQLRDWLEFILLSDMIMIVDVIYIPVGIIMEIRYALILYMKGEEDYI